MSRYEPGYFTFGECVLLDGEVIVDNRTFAEDAARELNAHADTIRLKSESLRIESENAARLRTKLAQTEIERDSALERARLWNESEVLMRNRALAAEEDVGRLRAALERIHALCGDCAKEDFGLAVHIAGKALAAPSAPPRENPSKTESTAR